MFISFINKNGDNIDIQIKALNTKLLRIFDVFSFYSITDIELHQNIFNNIKESEVMIIDQCIEKDKKEVFFVICFKKTLIIIKQSQILLLKNLFSYNQDLVIYFLPNSKDIFNESIKIQNQQFECDEVLFKEIQNFNENFNIIQKSGPHIDKISNPISSCITGYLIKQSYYMLNKKQLENMSKNFEPENEPPNECLNLNDFIILRNISTKETSTIDLVYQIENGELFVLKKSNKSEITRLINREYNNYLKIKYPLIPKLYGKIKDENCLIIQFINGPNLKNIDKLHLTEKDKVIIIFEIMLIINYLHQNNFVYRDLRPNNIMLDENKNIFLVDFDLMKSISDITNNEFQTNNFATIFAAPEINYNSQTFKNDIYSIGQMIFYIMNEKNPENCEQTKYMKQFYKRCTEPNPELRPDIKEILFEFYIEYSSYIIDSKINNFNEVKYFDGILNIDENIVSKDIDQIINYLTQASNQNYSIAQYILGIIYYEGKYISKDIEKSFYFLSLAADQNIEEAQIMIGMFYFTGTYISKNINKSIHYLSLAADQNNPKAQFQLGVIYYYTSDIEKAMRYITMAKDQNYPDAQFFLGLIYYKGEKIPQDIDKAIYYLTLAADQKSINAQFELGEIYYYGQYITRDIDKSIYYLTLAADQNYFGAQYNLGNLYYEGYYIKRDINKAIHYLTLASNQNFVSAQFNLGLIYFNDMSSFFDIEKAIHYFSLAAKQNCLDAQYYLGVIYYEGKYIKRDMDKSLYYLTLASNQNYVLAQYDLGVIFHDVQFKVQDIRKSIYYHSLAASQNYAKSQFNLGVIYYDNKLIPREIKKSIYYYTLASNQNYASAQFNLGVIYYEGKYITRDVSKSIFYLTKASDQNMPDAQYYLGLIYYNGEYIKRDINKAIKYLTLSANQNYSFANYLLGFAYYDGIYIKRDIEKAIYYLNRAANQNIGKAHFILGEIYYSNEYKMQNINKSIYHYLYASKLNQNLAQFKLGMHYLINTRHVTNGIYYLIQSASNGNINANFTVGYLYYEGKHIKKDIHKSIHHYKEASSFNDVYAKNNLGVIYKNGFGDEIAKNLGIAIEYFSEAIKLENDALSYFNLASIYIFGNELYNRIDDAINLLLKPSLLGFLPVYIILTLALIKKFGFNLDKIELEIFTKSSQPELISEIIIKHIIGALKLYDYLNFEEEYQYFKSIDYIYSYTKTPITTLQLNESKIVNNINTKSNNIDESFYEGFGIY